MAKRVNGDLDRDPSVPASEGRPIADSPDVAQLQGARRTTSIYGTPVPIVYGTVRKTGNVIASVDVGDSRGIWLALCEGPVVDIVGAWSNAAAFAAGVSFYSAGIGSLVTYTPGFAWGVAGIPTVRTIDERSDWIYPIAGQQFVYTVAHSYAFVANVEVSISLGFFTGESGDGEGFTPALTLGVDYTVTAGGTYTITWPSWITDYTAPGVARRIRFVYTATPREELASFHDGRSPQAPASSSPWYSTYFSALTNERFGQPYGGTAYLCLFSHVSGWSEELANALKSMSFEVQGLGAITPGGDTTPGFVVRDIFNNRVRGLGLQSERVGALTTYDDYCGAMGFTVSMVLAERKDAKAHLSDLLAATNATGIWAAPGKIDVIPYGDVAVSANGYTYTPDTTPVYDLTDDDFLCEAGEDPIEIMRPSVQSTFNCFPVEYLDRQAAYKAATVDSLTGKHVPAANAYDRLLGEDMDPGDVSANGLRRSEPLAYHCFTTVEAATAISRIKAQRSLFVRNRYKFRLPWPYMRLEPMALLSLTERTSGLSDVIVRITGVEVSEDGSEYAIEAEDWPMGIGHSTGRAGQAVPGVAAILTQSPVSARAMTALSQSSNRTWYRGNVSLTSPAPVIGDSNGANPRVAIVRRRWDTAAKNARVEITLQPRAGTDNLDGLRSIRLDWYRQSVDGTGAGTTVTLIDTTYLAMPDRRYFAPGTDTDAGNAVRITATLLDAGVSGGFPALSVQLVGASGASVGHCFYADTGNVDGSGLVDSGTSWPSGWGGSPPPPPGGDSGDGGGQCVAPETLVLVDGGAIPAGILRVGDFVKTAHETTGVYGAFRVTKVERHQSERVRVALVDGRTLVCSPNHRVMANDAWIEARRLAIGDRLDGTAPGIVESVEPHEAGDVMLITVESAHTYISNGVLSHNMKAL